MDEERSAQQCEEVGRFADALAAALFDRDRNRVARRHHMARERCADPDRRYRICGRGCDAVVCEEIVTGGALIVSVLVWVVGKMLCGRSRSWGSLCGRSRPPLAHDAMILPSRQ